LQSNPKYELQVRNAKLDLDNAKKTYNNLKKEKNNNFQIKTAQINYDNCTTANNKAGLCSKALLKLQLDSAKKTYQDSLTSAKLTRNKLQIAYNLAIKTAFDTKDQAQSQVKSAKIGYQKLQKAINDTKVRAPEDGIITSVSANLGDLAQGTLFTEIGTGQLEILVEVGEFDLATIEVGQEVTIKTDATGDDSFSGAVVAVASAATVATAGSGASATSNSSPKFTITVSINSTDPRLKIGMNARVSILQKSAKNVFAVPFDAVELTEPVTGNSGAPVPASGENSTTTGAGTLYVLRDGKPVGINVTTGIESDTLIQVEGPDLREGDKFIVNSAEMNLTDAEKREKMMQNMNR
jgi:multidrug efflux pump subunit AcrA (membrane-fusion protein)